MIRFLNETAISVIPAEDGIHSAESKLRMDAGFHRLDISKLIKAKET